MGARHRAARRNVMKKPSWFNTFRSTWASDARSLEIGLRRCELSICFAGRGGKSETACLALSRRPDREAGIKITFFYAFRREALRFRYLEFRSVASNPGLAAMLIPPGAVVPMKEGPAQ